MLQPQLGTLGLPKPMTGSNVLFFWDGMKHDVHNLWLNVMCVNATRVKQSNLQAHYNRFRFHLLFGGISLWILL
jgi:hypothetical protein